MKKIIVNSCLIILLIIVLSRTGENYLTFSEIMGFLFLTIVSTNGISSSLKKHGYSLDMMHWIFVLFFFVLAPIIQISYNFTPWGLSLTPEKVEPTIFLIVIWCVFYLLGSKDILNKKNKKILILPEKIDKNKINISKSLLLFLTIISSIVSVYVLSKVGFSGLFSRRTSYVTYSGSNAQTIGLIVDTSSRVLITYSFAISLFYYLKNKRGLLYFIICSMLLLLICFPTGLARNSAGIIYLGIFVIYYYSKFYKLKNSLKYFYVFIFAFMIIFPAINSFRTQDFKEVDIVQSLIKTIDNVSKNYLIEDYDAFSMVYNTKKYVEDYDIVYGRQLFGNLLFFIPRSVWSSKPEGSGSFIFKTYNHKFTNVSCPLLAELFINFGYIGLIFGAFFVGKFISFIDYKYWKNVENDINNDKIDCLTMLYPFLIPSYFFMLRGDFLSTFSFSSVYVVILLFISKISKYKIKIN